MLFNNYERLLTEQKNPNIHYNKELADEYYKKSENFYEEGNYKEGNKYLIMAIECGHNKNDFKEKYVVETPIFENKCLNDMLLVTFGLLDDFNKLNNKQVEQSK